jgi:large subunit ribosomal protein L5
MLSLQALYTQILARDLVLKTQGEGGAGLPKVDRIHVHFTAKALLADPTHLLIPATALTVLTGQRPKVIRARCSVATFKLRKGDPLGCHLTLRGQKMWAFLTQWSMLFLPLDPRQSSLALASDHPHLFLGLKDVLSFPTLKMGIDFFETLEGAQISLHMANHSSMEPRVGEAFWSGLGLPVHPPQAYGQSKP